MSYCPTAWREWRTTKAWDNFLSWFDHDYANILSDVCRFDQLLFVRILRLSDSEGTFVPVLVHMDGKY